MIHDELVTYEVAKLAKEKGFDEATYYTYEEESKRLNRMRYCVKRNSRIGSIIKLIAAPTQSLLHRWMREEKGVIIELKYSDSTEDWRPFWSWCIYNNWGFTLEIGDNFATYELALEDALKYALENLV